MKLSTDPAELVALRARLLAKVAIVQAEITRQESAAQIPVMTMMYKAGMKYRAAHRESLNHAHKPSVIWK
jgi:hypothetical protein